MKKILVTGGCGFIGSNLVESILKETDWNVNVIDNLSASSIENLENIKGFDSERINFFEGDIRNKNDVYNAIEKCDYVVNLAAQTGVIPSIEDPFKDAEVNIMGTLNLLYISTKKNIKKFIHASSAAPLGEQTPPLNENKIPKPLAPYGVSKLAGEGYCSAFYGSYGLKTVSLRFSNVYGNYSYHKQSVIPKFIRKAIHKEPITIFGDGKQTRDFIHVKDISRAILLSIKKDAQGLFQIGTGEETSVLELVDIIKEISGGDLEIKFKPERKGEIRRNYTQIDKAKKELGFKPSLKLKQGLKETHSWFYECIKHNM